ncbi:hypothetical protein [Massilia sp. CF038]|uniref:hypothetical protein n=1 Tax=Massilia sp. CF038 TaxID=1881045 RepID=UPI00091BD996|nr:hypothetical protein [Massilia sp. CF038]SHH04963.1 hypothetical protein SAMN05428948_2509 [Massilia sp. CF038]
MSRKHTEPPEASCQQLTIADSNIGQVSICPECSVLHLALSHVSLRFTPDAFRSLADIVTAAQSRLDHVAQTSAAAAAALAIDTARQGPKLH